jgi:hypothetical protein
LNDFVLTGFQYSKYNYTFLNIINTAYSLTGQQIRFGAERVPEYIDKCNKLTEDLDDIDVIGTQCHNSDCEWDGQKCITAKQSTFALASRYGSFFGSLFYTSITYDRAFGNAQRGVPAHAPYIIDVDVMNSLQDR